MKTAGTLLATVAQSIEYNWRQKLVIVQSFQQNAASFYLSLPHLQTNTEVKIKRADSLAKPSKWSALHRPPPHFCTSLVIQHWNE